MEPSATPHISDAQKAWLSQQSQPQQVAPTSVPIVQKPGETRDAFGNSLGQVISVEVTGDIPRVVFHISTVFFLITILYATLTLLLFGLIVALAIALSSAGIPGFSYLSSYPTIGILPTLTSLATMMFLYIAWKIRDGSRMSWLLGICCLASIPVAYSILLPLLASPLVKIVSVYAGNPEKPLPLPQISVQSIGQFFAVFLGIEVLLVVMLIMMKQFHSKSQALPANAKTALWIVAILFFLPVNGVVGYSFYQATFSDYGYHQVVKGLPYPLILPKISAGSRQYASAISSNDVLGGYYNAIKVTFDIPLKTIVNTGINSPITVKEVEVPIPFDMNAFVAKQDRNGQSSIQKIPLSQAVDGNGYIVQYGTTTTLWFLTSSSVLVSVSSPVADSEEIVRFTQTFE